MCHFFCVEEQILNLGLTNGKIMQFERKSLDQKVNTFKFYKLSLKLF